MDCEQHEVPQQCRSALLRTVAHVFGTREVQILKHVIGRVVLTEKESKPSKHVSTLDVRF
eukprot:3097069-Amphidinium_carterae.1